jgi:hypothetical protein
MTDFSKIKKLLGVHSPNGFSEREIADILHLVHVLPKPLIDYYKELGNYDFNYWQDMLIRSSEEEKYIKYERCLNDEYVIICCENQGICVVGIKKTDLSHENPPVYFSDDEEHWRLGCENLFDYIHGFVYGNTVFYLDYTGYFDVSDDGIDFIRTNFKNKNIKLTNWVVEGDHEFYGDYDDTIMLLCAETSLFYASNNKEHFMEMEKKWEGIDIEYK